MRINRRSFLFGLAAVPFAPAVLRDWAYERAEALPAPAPEPPPNNGMLAMAMGEPLAVTIAVPPNRLVKITGSMLLLQGGMVQLKEGNTVLAATYLADPLTDVAEAEVEAILRPTEGSHTYRLVADVPTYNSRTQQGFLFVQDTTHG
jgi:hypothetical protein